LDFKYKKKKTKKKNLKLLGKLDLTADLFHSLAFGNVNACHLIKIH